MESKPKIGILTFDSSGQKTSPYNADTPGLQMSKGTFDFPVIGEAVQGATGKNVVVEQDLTLTPHFIKAAKKLEQRGAKAISGQCGFMALFQQEITKSVSVPVLTSSLILVPLLYRMIGTGQKVSILTFNAKLLSEKHFNAVGWSSEDFPVVIAGVEEIESWKIFQKEKWDFKQMGMDLLKLVKQFVKENPDIGAIVLECTLMTQHAPSIQKVTGLPVFDITTLTRMVFEGIKGI